MTFIFYTIILLCTLKAQYSYVARSLCSSLSDNDSISVVILNMQTEFAFFFFFFTQKLQAHFLPM